MFENLENLDRPLSLEWEILDPTKGAPGVLGIAEGLNSLEEQQKLVRAAIAGRDSNPWMGKEEGWRLIGSAMDRIIALTTILQKRAEGQEKPDAEAGRTP